MSKSSPVIKPPQGWPFCLYICRTNPKPQIVLAESYVHARLRIGGQDVIIEPLMVIRQLQSIGHKETRTLLSTFGDQWCLKDGMVFYSVLK